MSENNESIEQTTPAPQSEATKNLERNNISDELESDKITLKTLENRASISSVDSSISLSFDAVPFTPRSSLAAAGSSTDDDETKTTTTPAATATAKTVCNGRHSGAAAGIDSSSSNESSTAAKEARTTDVLPDANDDDQEPFEPPDDELTKRIVDQVEYYFGDENIVKDAFLLKHVRRNKEGYVSLKLIASFKRVKHIARDWRVVRTALEKSTKLEINEAGTKLRRRDPLPLYDQTTPSRTVVAVHLPPERATIECVAEMFRECGEIALIRVLRPGNPVPADVRPFYNKHPEMQDSTSALIEFVRTESAHNALNREPSNGDPVRVLELNTPAAKKKVPTKKVYRNGGVPIITAGIYDDFSSSCLSSSEAEDRYRLRSLPVHANKTPPTVAADQLPHWSVTAGQQRRWSRESGSDSSLSSFTPRSRSNSSVYFAPEQRRLSAGWESSCSESYGSCRSRSSSGASVPEVFQMRRYSVPRKETACCCCGYNETAGRLYSIGQEEYVGGGGGGGGSGVGGYGPRTLSRCSSSNDSSDCGGSGSYRKQSISEYYQQPLQHRNSVTGGVPFERRASLTRSCNGDGNWTRSNSCSGSSTDGRRLSDSDGQQRFGGSMQRRGSFGNCGIVADTVVRLPRGPDGGRGFQREFIEYALPE